MKNSLFNEQPLNLMPLAARMRPQSIEEMVGQEHLLGEKGLLTGLLKQKSLPSLILWGPPGSGKTTLAQNLCRKLEGEMIHLSAVMAGVKEIREAVAAAQRNQSIYARKTYLFIDEIHRFNKAQQDALLPYVEDGTVTLLGATTENPSFCINNPLLSRCRVLVLKALDENDFAVLINRALTDNNAGLAEKNLIIGETAQVQLVNISSGDARILLGTLELAANLAAQSDSNTISVDHVVEAAGKRFIAYDQKGDNHYNVASAFIKSMRGSDPDAACHYLARMLEAGEDPRFIFRRLLIFASEDVGNADPQAIQVAAAACQAYEYVGLPEGYLPLTQATTYLACAPKSNAVTNAYTKAKSDVQRFGSLPVPLHICNAPTKFMKEEGYGRHYQYPHDFTGNYVKQQYLPDKIKESKYYIPTQNGYERYIFERLSKKDQQLTGDMK